ncbi:hypothetical protein HY620_01125 [Candidatus Uhrbacteria bacterium]|nr:hypothetical protein [Candidatus Uhrbacteria bacterium]
MKSSLSQLTIKKNSPVKNTIMLVCAVLIGIAAYLIYASSIKSFSTGMDGDSSTPLSLKSINWNETLFSTPAFKELKVIDVSVDATGKLGNSNPFERLKKE